MLLFLFWVSGNFTAEITEGFMKQFPSYEKVQHIQSLADTADRDNWVYAVVFTYQWIFSCCHIRCLMNQLIKRANHSNLEFIYN
jgi:hypothetical protein